MGHTGYTLGASPVPYTAHMTVCIETHISRVLLRGARAYKLKKPLRLPFLDFSTPERRRWFGLEELRLNRRTAPDLYLGPESVTSIPASRHARPTAAPN